MKTTIRFFILLIVVWGLLGSCIPPHSSSSSKEPEVRVSLTTLLQHFPADDALQEQLLLKALLSMPEDSLLKLIGLYARQNSAFKLRAEYALHALALNYPQWQPAQQNKLLRVWQTALPHLNNFHQQQFLIEQMALTGETRFATVLQPLFFKPTLKQAVLKALKQLSGAPCEQVVVQLLQSAPETDQVLLIDLCAQKGLQKCIEPLRKLANHSNPKVQQAAQQALAQLGDSKLMPQAKTNAQLGLHLAKALFESEKKKDAQALVWYWLTTDSEALTCPQRNAFLALAGQLNPEQALVLVEQKLPLWQNDSTCITGLLFTIEQWNDSLLATHLLKVFAELRPPVQIQLIERFAQKRNPFAFRTILGLMAETSLQPDVRRAAIQAQAHYGNPAAVPHLLKVLRQQPQNAELILNTLAVFDAQTYQDSLSVLFSQLPPLARKALLRFVANRGLKSLNPLAFQGLNDPNKEVRWLSWRALMTVGSQTQLDTLLQRAFQIQDDTERSVAFKALAQLVKSQKQQSALRKRLAERWPKATVEQKIEWLHLCRRMGGKAFFSFVQNALEQKDVRLQQAAQKTLLQWPDEEALPALLHTIKSSKDSKQKILALRQAVQHIRSSQMAAERAVPYLQTLLQLAPRSSEKQMVVAALGDFPSYQSVKLLSRLTADPQLGTTAFSALKRVLLNENETLEPQLQETFLAIVAAHATPQVLEAISQVRGLNVPPDGFEALFNGKDLSGWQAAALNPVQRRTLPPAKQDSLQRAADQEMLKHWKVQNGILMFDGTGYLSLQTKRHFKNFELLIDWKIEKNGDSGIYLRGCPQVQIWDPQQWQVGSGGLYNNQNHPNEPLTIADRPVGEWNRFRIIMKGDRVTVYLNDVLVVDNVVLENYWEREKPLYASGPIELQAHNSPLYFKNIFIKALPDEPPLFKGPLFNGKNLDGWQVVGNQPQTWGVKEGGILYTTGQGGGWLRTTRQFADFKLSLEFRVPPGGNSGIFLRAPLQGNPAFAGLEVQILDDYAQKYAHLKPWQYTGSVYAVQAPERRVTKPAGEWQKMVITCRGPEIQVELNGQLINRINLINYMHLEKEHSGIKRRKGFIGLQNHTSVVEFRNIFLEELNTEH